MMDEEEKLFLSVREQTGRNAFSRWRRDHAVENTPEAVTAAADSFKTAPLLLDPKLLDFCLWALGEARGRRVTGGEPFPATLWMGGAEDTFDGRAFTGNIATFVRLLHDRAKHVRPKRTGWVFEPTTNPKGRRTNEETKAMHALFLDCDGTGTWDSLLAVLQQLDFCYVAYQSGGWSPTTPKWRVVLPLERPYDTSSEDKQVAWKVIYTSARVVFGACARLLSVGFDPSTETPCCPWFLTEKREDGDTERQILWREGHSLDLLGLALVLPEVVLDDRAREEYGVVCELDLDEEQIQKIITALAAATSSVPTGRRELYLALPGALLDRGVNPDDVFAIIEQVSKSYPRQHADKHADNLHNARTTIARWQAGERYTRIGTLATTAPVVATALDITLPDPTTKAILDGVEQILREQATSAVDPYITSTTPTVETSSPSSSSSPSSAQPRKNLLLRRSNLGKQIVPIAARARESAKADRKLTGIVLDHFLDGLPLPTNEHTSDSSVDEMVSKAMRMLGRALPVKTRWQEVLDFASASLSLSGVTQSVERVENAQRAFYEGQGARNRSNNKKALASQQFAEAARTFFDNKPKAP